MKVYKAKALNTRAHIVEFKCVQQYQQVKHLRTEHLNAPARGRVRESKSPTLSIR